MEKMSKKNKGGKKAEVGDDGVTAGGTNTSRRTNSSAGVFKNLQAIVKDDYKKKEDKKAAKAAGKAHSGGAYASQIHSNQSAKKFMM